MLSLNRKPWVQKDDRELVTCFLAERHEDIFRELYRRHTPLIYRTSVRLLAGEGVRTSGGPEDATQECWLRAVRGLSSFAWQSRLSTWLVGIVIRTCAELRRSSADVLDFDEHREATDAVDPHGLRLENLDVERLLLQVAPGYRAVVILHDLEGFTHQEIADALQVEPGTVESQLSRGRQALRAIAEQSSIATGRSAL